VSAATVSWRYPPGIPGDRGTVATVGTFDGVHLGHWRVLEEIRERAEVSGRRAVLVTFDPHPLRVVRPDDAPPLLTTPVEKKEILAESGLDFAVFVRFTEALSRYEPRRFIEEILVGRLGVEELVIGYDHGFGRNRSGDASTIRHMGGELGFSVDVVEPVEADSQTISSSRIRRAVQELRFREARSCLGRPYSVRGVVVRGEGRGRGLGFPTANLQVGDRDKLVPPTGVYAVRGILRDGAKYPGALHIGPRPTFQGSPPTIELHLIGFEGDLYGEEIKVEFVDHLRGVHPFDGVEALVAQLRQDVEATRRAVDADG
jgi:riboflavin kinase / FMN adenylyltransferase